MKPPGTTEAGDGAAPGQAPAVSVRPEGLKKRADFLALNRGRRRATPGFVLQARDRADGDPAMRMGFTCSRKVGNAVARNRSKRRLREIARLELPAHGRAGWDYVLIGRKDETAARDFARMREDLRGALRAVHGDTASGPADPPC